MSGPISPEENETVSQLKKQGVFLKFDPKEFSRWFLAASKKALDKVNSDADVIVVDDTLEIPRIG